MLGNRFYRRVLTAIALYLVACLPLCGAELPEAPEGTFSVVVIPDTQHYRRLKQDDQAWENPTFEAYTGWIATNIERQRIVFVSHVGDIVDLNERPQWSVARRCMDQLHGLFESLSDYGVNGLRVMRFVPKANRIEVRLPVL